MALAVEARRGAECREREAREALHTMTAVQRLGGWAGR